MQLHLIAALAYRLPCPAGAIVAGPRIGRFTAEGKPVDMPGHNTIFYMMGVLLLWVRQMCSYKQAAPNTSKIHGHPEVVQARCVGAAPAVGAAQG